MTSHLSRSTATFIGFTAVLLWSLLAFLTAASGTMPAFQLTAITFAIGGLSLLLIRPGAIKAMRQPLPVWLLGVGGLFGYHFCYFFALRNAPPVEAGLINYLWPLLIVVFSALLPGERLRWQHVAGCALALTGAVLVVTRGQGFGFDAQFSLGYATALCAAGIWAAYSVLSRRFADVPSESLSITLLACAVPAFALHLAFEQTLWSLTAVEWGGVLGLGLGSIGLAFIVWDIGMKKGDVALLGVASYAAPVLSTLTLVAAGYAAASWTLALACALTVVGALVASRPGARAAS